MTTLKPCPFCGNPTPFYSAYDRDGGDSPSVLCEECGAEVPGNTKGKATKAWNRRV